LSWLFLLSITGVRFLLGTRRRPRATCLEKKQVHVFPIFTHHRYKKHLSGSSFVGGGISSRVGTCSYFKTLQENGSSCFLLRLGRETFAWNQDVAKSHVFGEGAGAFSLFLRTIVTQNIFSGRSFLGGGISSKIGSCSYLRPYNRNGHPISAWYLATAKTHLFGEEAGTLFYRVHSALGSAGPPPKTWPNVKYTPLRGGVYRRKVHGGSKEG
jgi:hypothetical protein